jgi:hypothetical protein
MYPGGAEGYEGYEGVDEVDGPWGLTTSEGGGLGAGWIADGVDA